MDFSTIFFNNSIDFFFFIFLQILSFQADLPLIQGLYGLFVDFQDLFLNLFIFV